MSDTPRTLAEEMRAQCPWRMNNAGTCDPLCVCCRAAAWIERADRDIARKNAKGLEGVEALGSLLADRDDLIEALGACANALGIRIDMGDIKHNRAEQQGLVVYRRARALLSRLSHTPKQEQEPKE